MPTKGLREHGIYHRNFAKLAMHINADKMTTLHSGPPCVTFPGVLLTASLPNDHHGRPDFFYLQKV
jgi:hypothetical protein